MIKKIAVIWICLLIIIGSIVILIKIAEKVEAPTTLYVGGSGGGNYSTIIAAIADAVEGDTIFVYNGTYFESFNINKGINFIGENKSNTIIDGQGLSGQVIRCRTDWLNITGFSIINRTDGIYMDFSSNNSVSDCYFEIYRHGVLLEYCEDINITSNEFTKGGLYIYGFDILEFNTHNITNNTVDNKPLLFYKNCKDYNINGIPIGQLILVNCSDINVENLTINGTNVGLEIVYSTKIDVKNSIITNCTLQGVYIKAMSHSSFEGNDISKSYQASIFMDQSFNNKIVNNSLDSNNMYGLHIISSSNNTLSDNNLSNNLRDGIFLGVSKNNTVSENLILNNDPGIHIAGESDNNKVLRNIIESNTLGIRLGTSSNNNLSYNIITENDFGISFYSVISENDNNITYNTLINNSYGIYFRDSSDNFMYKNTL
jgi:parallel beta-helix repeat protein